MQVFPDDPVGLSGLVQAMWQATLLRMGARVRKLKGCSSSSGSPGWQNSLSNSMLRLCTRAGVPVLNRRSGSPRARRLSVRAVGSTQSYSMA